MLEDLYYLSYVNFVQSIRELLDSLEFLINSIEIDVLVKLLYRFIFGKSLARYLKDRFNAVFYIKNGLFGCL